MKQTDCLSFLRCACLPQRYVMAVYLVIGMIFCYLMRVSVFMAINEMTFKIAPRERNDTAHTYCPSQSVHVNKTFTRAEFHWDQQMQHDIITSIYIGYIIAHVPAGILADLFGGKHVFGGGVLLSAILSLSFPILARWSPYAFMLGRIAQGFGQGVMFPSMSTLIAKWAPPNERSTMTGIVQSGVMFGNAAGLLISGLILDAFPTWEPIFYICGGTGLLWCLGWYTLCYSSPAEHPFITEKEKNMIITQIAQSSKEKPETIPWCSILTSLPFIAAVLANFGHAWAIFTMVNEMPVYMTKVLNFDIKSSGLYAALPHIAMCPTSIGTGYFVDFLIRRKTMSVSTSRKVFTFLANVLPIPFMLGASFSGCDIKLVIILFMVMMFFKGLCYATCRANPVDLSPNYAGILMGIMNGIGSFAGLLGSTLVPFFITGDGSIQEWRNVFYLTAIIMVMFTLPYTCFASGEVQPWNNIESQKNLQQPEPQHKDTEESKT